MPPKKPLDPDAKPQIEKFREAAIEVGCDDDEALKKLLRAGPAEKYEPKKRKWKS